MIENRGSRIEDRRSRIEYGRSRRISLFDPRSSILDPLFSILDPSRSELGLQPPRLAVRLQIFAEPAKGRWRNVFERPSYLVPVSGEPFLDYVFALPATYQIVAYAGDRIEPGDAPDVDLSVVDPHRRPVAVKLLRQSFIASLGSRRRDPDVLDCAPLQHPSEMPLPTALVRGTILRIIVNGGLPTADKPSVDVFLICEFV